uniref:HrUrabin-Short n=1 Tax=Halocynthia roretzi TaxID=7729 RepID=B3XX22_HALRO|nr:HrUrabin-Short [Halocynthia roretzi]
MYLLPTLCFIFVILLQILACVSAEVRILTTEEKQLLLDEHNKARSEVVPKASNMKYMTWDATLAGEAVALARVCVNQHSNLQSKKYPRTGENLFASAKMKIDASWLKTAMRMFVEEKKDYNYEEDSCSLVCGHYTQVVWASSVKVGCGASICDNIDIFDQTWDDGQLLFCRYAPPGNYFRKKPYEEGEPCFDCELEETCRNNTCATAEDLKAVIEDDVEVVLKDEEKPGYDGRPDGVGRADGDGGSAQSVLIQMSLLVANVLFAYLLM